MNDPDEPDWERMRQEEDNYFAVKESPPQTIGEVAAAVLAKARRAVKQSPRKPVGAKP